MKPVCTYIDCAKSSTSNVILASLKPQACVKEIKDTLGYLSSMALPEVIIGTNQLLCGTHTRALWGTDSCSTLFAKNTLQVVNQSAEDLGIAFQSEMTTVG